MEHRRSCVRHSIRRGRRRPLYTSGAKIPIIQANPMEEILTDLPRHGTLIKNRAYRQVWRFEFNGKPYYLKFYPRGAKQRFAANPAMREFLRLQMLQKATVPSPRACNALVGFRLNGQMGDALIVEGLGPSV